MRKVILSMTMPLDGFFCGPNGELDWMSQTPDQEKVCFQQESTWNWSARRRISRGSCACVTSPVRAVERKEETINDKH